MEQENISQEQVNLGDHIENKEAQPESLEGVSEVEVLKKQLNEKISECKDWQNKFLLAKADLDNARKRFARDKEDVRARAIEYACMPIFSLFDSFKMGLESVQRQGGAEEILKGFQMIFQQFQNALKALNVEAVEPKEADTFDPHLHEAVSNCPHDTIAEGGVVQLVRSGYKLNDKLIRPASVVVSSGAEKKEGNA